MFRFVIAVTLVIVTVGPCAAVDDEGETLLNLTRDWSCRDPSWSSNVPYEEWAGVKWKSQFCIMTFTWSVRGCTGTVDFTSLPASLEVFDIGHNNFRGPANFSALPVNLLQFDISHNFFNGTLDLSMAPQALKTVFMGNNAFNGTVNWASFKRLRFTTLDLSRNDFEGPIVLTSMPPFLYSLYLYSNRFSGSLTNLSSLPPSVDRLDVGRNLLSGVFNFSALPRRIRVLNLGSNNMTGFVRLNTVDMPALKTLEDLIINNNFFTGTLGNLSDSRLQYFYIASNSITGTLEAKNFPGSILQIDVSKTRISGAVNLGNLSLLRKVLLSDNDFCGIIILPPNSTSPSEFLTDRMCVGRVDPTLQIDPSSNTTRVTCQPCLPLVVNTTRPSIRDRIEQISQTRQMVQDASVAIAIVASALVDSGGASLLQAGRTGLIVRLLDCEANKMSTLSRSDHPTGISVAVAGPEGSDAFAGSTVVNAVIVASTWCVHGASVWLTGRRATNRGVNVAAQLYFPAHSIRMHMFFLQSLVTSSLFVLMNVSGTGWRVLALAILAADAGIILGLMWYVLTHSTPRVVYEERDDNPMPLALAPRLLWHVMHKTGTWTSTATYPGYHKQYTILFDDYTPGRQWFLLVELFTTLALAIVGCAPTENCGTLNSVTTAILLLNVFAMGALRPYHTRSDMVVSAICAFGNLLTLVLHSIGGWAHTDLGESGLDTAADLVMLTVSIVAVAKAVCGAARLARKFIGSRKKPQMEEEVPLEMPLVGAGGPIKGNTLTAGHQAVIRVEDVNALKRPTARGPPRQVIHDADL